MVRVQKERINHLTLLVHPLYSFFHPPETLPESKRLVTLPVDNVAVLLEEWTNDIIASSRDPSSFLVVVRWQPNNEELSIPSVHWANEHVTRLLAAAHEIMGGRMLTVPFGITPSSLRAQICRKGYKVSPSWEGRAFGEYWSICVDREMKRLRDGLSLHPHDPRSGRHSIVRVPHLSLDSLGYGRIPEHSDVWGTMHDQLRLRRAYLHARGRFPRR